MSRLGHIALAIGSLSCAMLLGSALSACSDMRTVEEKLRHRAVKCVITRLGDVCEKEKGDASVPVPVTAP